MIYLPLICFIIVSNLCFIVAIWKFIEKMNTMFEFLKIQNAQINFLMNRSAHELDKKIEESNKKKKSPSSFYTIKVEE